MLRAAGAIVISAFCLSAPLVGGGKESGEGAVKSGATIELRIGESLEGWIEEQHNFYKKKHPDVKTWSVKDGVLVCDGKTGNCGFLRYDKRVGDFTLQLQYRMSKKCNSGVCFRSAEPYDGNPDKTLPSRLGYEFQIFDDAGQPPTKTSSGSFYNRVAPTENASRPAGEWNTLEIVCRGPKVRATLNGKVVQDLDQTRDEAIGDRPREGYILLQNHGYRCEFKDLRLIVESPK